MAVLLKEASPADEVPARPRKSEPLQPPFDVVTYAGPVTVEGYERLSTVLEQQRTNDQVLVVLETPGGDPHAAFRIARALGFHYQRVEALVPRYCKSAGTLIVLGASVLHMGDRGELGPIDMQIPRVGEFSIRGSGLEFGGVLDQLLPHQIQSFAIAVRAISAQGLSNEAAVNAASLMTARMFRPVLEKVDPRRLVEVTRAMAIAAAYGERLAQKGGNIDADGINELMRRYPSHAFAIDRKEARRLFFDVREPIGAVAEIATRLGHSMASLNTLAAPTVQLFRFPFIDKEDSHVLEGTHARGFCPLAPADV
ncbi:SDH family Clp fold serine proteinase [Roseateles sp. L2-2]